MTTQWVLLSILAWLLLSLPLGLILGHLLKGRL